MYEVRELLPLDDRIARPRPVVEEPELHEPVPFRVHSQPGLHEALDDRARSVDDVVHVDERALAREKILRMDGPAGKAEQFPDADLRNEPGVGAKPVREILVQREPVEVRRIVAPVRHQRVTREPLPVPLVSHVGPVRRAALAEQQLSGDCVVARWPPLKVRPGDAVVAVAAMGFAIGHERSDR